MVKEKLNPKIWIPIVLVVLDQFLKYLIRTADPSIDLGFLKVVFAKNTGMAFSMLTGYNIFLMFIGMVFVSLMIYYRKPFIEETGIPAYILILSGALSNLIDRILFGYVVDMISIGNFPVFNLSDSMITIGAMLVILKYIREKKVKK